MIRMSFQLPSNDTHELVGLRGRRQSNMVSSNEYNQVKIGKLRESVIRVGEEAVKEGQHLAAGHSF